MRDKRLNKRSKPHEFLLPTLLILPSIYLNFFWISALGAAWAEGDLKSGNGSIADVALMVSRYIGLGCGPISWVLYYFRKFNWAFGVIMLPVIIFVIVALVSLFQ